MSVFLLWENGIGDCKTLAFPFQFVFEVALPPQKLDFGEQSEPSRRPNERSEGDQRESLDWKTQFYNRLENGKILKSTAGDAPPFALQSAAGGSHSA
ncbi:MAG: hypothetical protein DBY36_04220 [Clostridiales bacterium]|nr:MAG: hypothetical protein DBY36_04220 [Clostridiales bacterium]